MDADKVEQLLNILEATMPTKWPMLKAIHDAALAELSDMIPDIEKELDERRKARIAEEQKVAAAEAAKVKATKDAEEKAKPRVIPAQAAVTDDDMAQVDRRL